MSDDNKILLTYVHGSNLHSDFVHSVINAIVWDLGNAGHLTAPGGWANNFSGPNISHARNQLVQHFLHGTDADWMLSVDSDIVFPPWMHHRIWETAHELGATVLSGLYWGARARAGGGVDTFPVALNFPDGKVPGENLTELPDKPIIIGGAGAGYILFHRSALQAVEDAKYNPAFPWFHETERDGVVVSEDLELCLRLAETGHPVWFDPRIEVAHMKTLPLIRELMSKPLIP